jgi:predicted Zn-dependent protease
MAAIAFLGEFKLLHCLRNSYESLITRALIFYSFIACIFFISSCVSLVDVETMSATEFSKMRSSMSISDNVKQRDYVNCVVQNIVSELPEPYKDMNWDVEIFENNAANAFAMAGGKIGVFTGIFKVAKNQDQFASVIGHEIAHVTQDHMIDRINRAQVTGGAIQLAAIVLGDQTSIGSENTQILLEGAAELGMELPFGRKQESESDVLGLKYMASAGFDPRASIQLWKNMADYSGDGKPEFLSTHPSSASRISDLDDEMPEALGYYSQALASEKKPTCNY